MDYTSIIWIFLIFISLAPMVKQRVLDSERLRLMRHLEEKRGSRVIALIHRQESMSFWVFRWLVTSTSRIRRKFYGRSR
jgi:Periplasmic serine proteases (ClpP class)